MPNSKRNRESEKENEKENRRGSETPVQGKRTDNPRNLENVSTADNERYPKDNKADVRKEKRES
jgi:hypothetical protein